jgi:hypothetical protein
VGACGAACAMYSRCIHSCYVRCEGFALTSEIPLMFYIYAILMLLSQASQKVLFSKSMLLLHTS